MIIESIMNLLKIVITSVFGVLPNIPNLDNASAKINEFFDLIFSNAQIVGCFINPNTIKICIPVIIVILNFEKIYKITLWILKKIPMLGIK